MNNFWVPFITGLTTGGISCFAVQGSLLTSALATEKSIANNVMARSLIVFLIFKLLAYAVLGFFLGLIGGSLVISPKAQGIFQIFIGIYLIVTAANLANIHPFFKNFVIRPPKFIFRLLRNQTKVKSFFTPGILGILTVFIPCGVTQAMMLLAISAGNPFSSTLILSSFVLGTIPAFFLIGLAASELFKRKAFSIISAFIVAGLGLYSINSGLVLRGSVHTFQNYRIVIFSNTNEVGNIATITEGFQQATINVTSRGYTSDVKNLKINIPVRLKLVTNSTSGCARAFTIPDYNISKVLPQTGTEILEFIPTKLGNLTYSCSMGMYSGYFNVVE